MEEILLAYRKECLALREDPRIKLIMIFKNHGEAAGTSLDHTHSQIVGTSIVPSNIRKKLEEAARYYDDHGRCVFCDSIAEELSLGTRIVMNTDTFVVLEPFASRSPFETWIVSKKHEASFGLISMEDSKKFAKVLKQTLLKLYSKLKNPDYNFVIHTAPIRDGKARRTTTIGTFQVVPDPPTPPALNSASGSISMSPFPRKRLNS